MKKVIVSTCEECPHSQIATAGPPRLGDVYRLCIKSMRVIRATTVGIPDFCPLEDAS